MIVAEKYKHRPHPLEVVEVTRENYLEVAAYIGSSDTNLSHSNYNDTWTVGFEFAPTGIPIDGPRQHSIHLELPGKISINHQKLAQTFDEDRIKTNYKKA